MTTAYVTMKSLRVSEGSVHAGFYSAGMPSLTATAGFAEALSMKLASHFGAVPTADPYADSETFAVKGFGLAFASMRTSAGGSRRVVYEEVMKNEAGGLASVAYDPLADFTVELVLEVDSSMAASALEARMRSSEVTAIVQSMRFAGGTLLWSSDATVHESVPAAFAALSRYGFVLEDATEVLAADIKAGADVLLAMQRRVSRPHARPTADDDSGRGETQAYEPRYVPIACGYATLESPSLKANVKRAGYPHAFAEPVLGLGRLRLGASAAKAVAKDGSTRFIWRHDNATPGLLVLRAR